MSETAGAGLPAAGWYPDPHDAAQQRWWDGVAWSDARQPAPRVDVPTGTVWIWLNVLLPLVTLPSLLLLDTSGYLQSTFQAAYFQDERALAAASASYLASTLIVTIIGFVVIGLGILFAWLDWRELGRRGIPRPFAWPWALFALFATNGVYVIGRGVVLRRRTGRGLGPVWGWIAVTAVSLIVGLVYAGAILSQTAALIAEYSTYYPR